MQLPNNNKEKKKKIELGTAQEKTRQAQVDAVFVCIPSILSH